jgi:hypothetical protein
MNASNAETLRQLEAMNDSADADVAWRDALGT